MNKKKINQFHNKYPFVESIFLFIIGILVGIFTSLLTGEIISNGNYNWRAVDSWYFWIVAVLMLFGIIYYWKFSSYSIGRQMKSVQIANATIIDLVTVELKKELESDTPITFEKKLTLARKTAQTIHEVDKLSTGGADDV